MKTGCKLNKDQSHKVTRNFIYRRPKYHIDITKKRSIRSILVYLPEEAMTFHIIVTSLLQEIVATFPDCKIDLLLTNKQAIPIFKNFQNIGSIIFVPHFSCSSFINYAKVIFKLRSKRYDLAINAGLNMHENKFWWHWINARNQFLATGKNNHAGTAENCHVIRFRKYLEDYILVTNRTQVPKIDIRLDGQERFEGRHNFDAFDNSLPVIGLIRDALPNDGKDILGKLYQVLKTELPQFNIIEIFPDECAPGQSRQISFRYQDIRKTAALLSATQLCITTDTALAFLAAAVNTPVLVLYSDHTDLSLHVLSRDTVRFSQETNVVQIANLVKNMLDTPAIRQAK